MVRLLIWLSVPLALAVGASARSQENVTQQDAGKLYAQRCGDCHSPRAVSAWGRKMPDEQQRRQWLEGFLKTHYPPPEAERALIIEHIQSQIARR